MRIGFCGPSYTLSSTAIADEECINFFPQTVESQAAIVPTSPYGGKQASGLKALIYTPGLSLFIAFPNGPVRGQCFTGTRAFAVSGSVLYEYFAGGNYTALGDVGNDGLPVSIVASAIQLLIVSAGNAYCFTLKPGQWKANTAYQPGTLILDDAGHIQSATPRAWAASTAYALATQIIDPNGNIQQASQAAWVASTAYVVGVEIVDPAGHIQKASALGWIANTAYALGQQIVDSNGNVQQAYAASWAANTSYALGAQIVDSNGNVQEVTTAGESGASAPIWSGGGATPDGTGSLVWTYQASAGGDAGTSGAAVPVWSRFGGTLDGTGTLVWVYQSVGNGNAGTSGTVAPAFNDTGGSVADTTLGTLIWNDEGLAVGAGTSGLVEPIFNMPDPVTGITADTPDAGALIWVYQKASAGSAGTSGAVEPVFNDAGSSVADGTGTLTWSDRGLRLLIVTGQLAGVPVKAEYADSYFVVIFSASNKFQESQVLDGTTWPGQLVNEVEVFSDNIVSIIANHRELWVLGALRGQPYQDTGSTEVYDVIPGTMLEKGCAATFVPCRVDNSVFLIDQDERGALSAWRSNGYIPVRISTFAVEYDLSTYTLAQIQGMTSYSYEDRGHLFWVIYIPGSQWSWVFDVVEGMWHKRAFWNEQTAQWQAHNSWNHAYAFGMHLVGDWNSGNLYQMSAANLTDYGVNIRRLRRSPTVLNEMARIFHAELTLDFDTGLGPQPPFVDGDGNPRPPIALLRFSDDRGKTWSNIKAQGCGFAGQYRARCVYRRLGVSRYRVYELSVSDPIPWTMVDAYLRLGDGGAQA